MNYIIKHANGECTPLKSPLSIEDLFAFIKSSEDQFIIFKADDMLFIGTDYIKSCLVMNAKEPEQDELDSSNISDYF